ncbi:MAG: hypothetical protein Greene041614_856 [Parcubacteria group bacterium Greene0416_14]|nr:MAG: hypothetical protein Greene041614_856 [Parcubacteria group bacterium Greene0416_14]TSD00636.1 MAG: hypothetical protein Greene101415_739 [Parcubacteria group bacterium Greene1014_15]TSD08072.1 MAG: hypothetical protein Greene07144_422 [Parcubacteria group bacterium Greene0714_4]
MDANENVWDFVGKTIPTKKELARAFCRSIYKRCFARLFRFVPKKFFGALISRLLKV